MRASTLALASILAVAVSAQQASESCTNAAALLQTCIPVDGTTEEDFTRPEVANCFCRSGTFDDDIVTCLQEAGSLLPEEVQQALEAYDGYCARYGNGGGSSPGNTGSPTRPSETDTGNETSEPTTAPTGGSPNCNYIVKGLQSCYTDGSVSPTAAPVAMCLCSGGSFDAAVDGCLDDLSDDEARSSVALFTGFCSSFSAGGFGGSGPTATDDDTSPTPTNGPNEEDATSTGRVIQTLNPQTTSGSNTNGGNNNGGSGPNSAAGLKVTILGTAMAALLAGAALIL